MESLARKYSGKVDFYILYVREAHPGENYPAQKSFSDKTNRAKDLKRLENVGRTILIDSFEGSMHRDYGDRPNSVYVIGRDGIILSRADWSDPELLEQQLATLLGRDGYTAGLEPVSLTDNYTPVTPELTRTTFRVLRRSGFNAMVDFWFSSSYLARARARRLNRRVTPQQVSNTR